MRPVFSSLLRAAESVFMKRPASFDAAKKILETSDSAVTATAKSLEKARRKFMEVAPGVVKFGLKTSGTLFMLFAGDGDVPTKRRPGRKR